MLITYYENYDSVALALPSVSTLRAWTSRYYRHYVVMTQQSTYLYF